MNHQREFLRHYANHAYETTDDGVILFPKAHAQLSGIYGLQVNDGPIEQSPNLLPDQGIFHMLDVTFHQTTPVATWYLALYGGNYTPTAGLTAANFATTALENTNTAEGYTETTRREWVEGAATGSGANNLNSPALFTFATATSVNIHGAALLSNNVRGTTAGILMSATKFPTVRNFQNGDTFSLTYQVALTSV